MAIRKNNKEILNALIVMVEWATTGNKSGNPYCKDEIKYALKVMEKNGCCPVEWQNICAKEKTPEMYLNGIKKDMREF